MSPLPRDRHPGAWLHGPPSEEDAGRLPETELHEHHDPGGVGGRAAAGPGQLEEAKKACPQRTRGDKRAELTHARGSRGMWIALGAGTLAAVALIVGLLFLFFAEESASSVTPRPRRPVNLPERRQRRAQRSPAPEERASTRTEPARRPDRSRQSARNADAQPRSQRSGGLWGNGLPRQVGASR